MNKGFLKISVLLSVIALAFIAGLILFTQPSTKTALATTQSGSCIYSCPVVHFEWNTTVYDNCPNGYSVRSGHSDQCRKNIYPFTVITRPSHQVSHSADVQYEKSNDPHKCHRPSDDELEDDYGMDHDTRQAFKQANSEWKDSIVTVPDGYYQQGDACYPKTPVCVDDSATNYGGEDHQFNPEQEIPNNQLCQYPQPTDVCKNLDGNQSEVPQGYHQDGENCVPNDDQPTDVCSNIEGNQASLPEGYHYDEQENCVPNEGEPTVAPTAVPTVTPTPTTPPAGHGDGLSDGRSSCPECTQAPKVEGQVLGASTGQVLGASTMAKTGNFETKAMNLYMIFGMFLLLAGYTSYAKEKRFN